MREPRYRLTQLRVRNFRIVEDVSLDLEGLCVLIGANGCGKSSLIEALEILRRCCGHEFFRDLQVIHGGVRSLVRHDATTVTLGCRFTSSGPPDEVSPQWLDYEIEVSDDGVLHERATASPRGRRRIGVVLFSRAARRTARGGRSSDVDRMLDADLRDAPVGATLLARSVRVRMPELRHLREAVASIQVQVAFDVLPRWVAAAHGRPAGVRGAELISRVDAVERLGSNLASVYAELRNDHGGWPVTLGWIRLALGDWVESVDARPDAASGSIALWIKHTGRDLSIPARALSDGQLQLLGIVAICRLQTGASVIAFDEPETHLHPQLHARVAQFFARLSESTTVVLATHSRRILDALDRPTASVRVMDVVAGSSPAVASLRCVDAQALDAWLKEYDGLGAVLDAGLGSTILADDA